MSHCFLQAKRVRFYGSETGADRDGDNRPQCGVLDEAYMCNTVARDGSKARPSEAYVEPPVSYVNER